jgi:hypothetical protein
MKTVTRFLTEWRRLKVEAWKSFGGGEIGEGPDVG